MATVQDPERATQVYYITIRQCVNPLRGIITLYLGPRGWTPNVVEAMPYTMADAMAMRDEISGADITSPQ